MLTENYIDIEKEINSNRHKKDPFLKKYVDLTTSTVTVKSDNDFNELSLTCKLRTSLINAQISALVSQLSGLANIQPLSAKTTHKDIVDIQMVKNDSACQGLFIILCTLYFIIMP